MKNLMPLTFCFFLQVVILMISLPAIHCRRSFQSNDETLMENTCKKTPNYNLCLQSLKSIPRSSSANVSELAVIMLVNVMYKKADYADVRIRQLIDGSEGAQKVALRYCLLRYIDITAYDIPDACIALQTGNPKKAEQVVNGSDNVVTLCEKGFSGKSPITKENNDVHDIATIATAIIRQSF